MEYLLQRSIQSMRKINFHLDSTCLVRKNLKIYKNPQSRVNKQKNILSFFLFILAESESFSSSEFPHLHNKNSYSFNYFPITLRFTVEKQKKKPLHARVKPRSSHNSNNKCVFNKRQSSKLAREGQSIFFAAPRG